jgi:hypothetical protein
MAMSISWDEENSQWHRHLSSDVPGTPDSDPELTYRLSRTEYWAVYCGPIETQCGGDLWVFVAKDTGHIVGWVGGM